MAGKCCLCGAATERNRGQNLVEYGSCNHLEHLQCVLRKNLSGACVQCRRERNKRGDTTDAPAPLYLLGAYADAEFLRGVAWKSWEQRVRRAPVDFTTALEACPIARSGGDLPVAKEREIEVVAVDPKDLVLAGHPDESRTQGMVRMTLKEKQRVLEVIRSLNGNEFPMEVLHQSGITFSDLKQCITNADGTPCSFIVWNKRTSLAPEDLVSLGAKFRDLIDCGLNVDNANSTLISPDVYLGKPLYTRYGEILKELCDKSWKKFFRIMYKSRYLKAMGLTVESLLVDENFAWRDFRFLKYLGVSGIYEWGFCIEHVARIHSEKYTGDMDRSVFGAHFCTKLMEWTPKDCEKYFHVTFKALAK